MGRRTGVFGIFNAVARDVACAQREAEAAQRRAVREHERIVRAAARAGRDTQRRRDAAAREAKKQYLEDRQEEAHDRTDAIESRVAELEHVLIDTLSVDDAIDFDSLRLDEAYPDFQPPPHLVLEYREPQLASYVDAVPKLGFVASLMPGAAKRHGAQIAAAHAAFERDQTEFQKREAERHAELQRARQEYESKRFAAVWKATQRNAEVAEFEQAYLEGDRRAIIEYNELVLERSEYPEGFPHSFKIAYVPESFELVVDYELPAPSIVPPSVEVKYVKTRDDFEEKPRKAAEIKELYQRIVAAVALRTLHEVFESDHDRHIAVVTFNGFVQTVDPATGRDIAPYLISVRATSDQFATIDLARVDRRACLRNLGANVSPSAADVVPVKPIVEFDMVDERFVDQQDVIRELDARPNIMDLTPIEFESLVANVFGRMGLETRQTRASRDGGVDVVAFDARPVLGGKVVIQAKRYRNTVGVGAVRDLFGTMMNEGANKGILVTTSGYGRDAFEFAKDKPIELLAGGAFLYLCEQVGVQARIVMPDDATA